MPIRLNSSITSTFIAGNPRTVTPAAVTVWASVPKYTATIAPMKTQRIRRKRPCVSRYVLHVSYQLGDLAHRPMHGEVLELRVLREAEQESERADHEAPEQQRPPPDAAEERGLIEIGQHERGLAASRMLKRRNYHRRRSPEGRRRLAVSVLVVLDTEVRDLLLAHHPAQRVLQLGLLNEQVVLGVQPRRGLRALKVEGQPFLNAREPGASGQVEEQRQIEHDRRGEDPVPAQEVDFDLHRIAEPSEDVDVVPAFFVVAPRRVVIDPHLVVDLAIQLGIKIRLEDVLEQTELRFFLGLERLGGVQHFAVSVAQDGW